MRLTRLHVVLAAGVVAVSGSIAGAAMGSAQASPNAAAPHVVLVNQCSGKGQVRPLGNVPLPGCMTSSELIGRVKWTSWASSAFGSGDLEVNNCTPSSKCGPSKFTKYPVLIVLWRPEKWAGKKGDDYFSRMTWIFTGKRPKHAPVTQTTVWLPAAE
jgi:hypothetical protein